MNVTKSFSALTLGLLILGGTAHAELGVAPPYSPTPYPGATGYPPTGYPNPLIQQAMQPGGPASADIANQVLALYAQMQGELAQVNQQLQGAQIQNAVNQAEDDDGGGNKKKRKVQEAVAAQSLQDLTAAANTLQSQIAQLGPVVQMLQANMSNFATSNPGYPFAGPPPTNNPWGPGAYPPGYPSYPGMPPGQPYPGQVPPPVQMFPGTATLGAATISPTAAQQVIGYSPTPLGTTTLGATTGLTGVTTGSSTIGGISLSSPLSP